VPPPLPPADRTGCLLRTRVSRQRRRSAQRAFGTRVGVLLGAVAVVVVLGVLEPEGGVLAPEWYEQLRAGLPGPLGALSALQLAALPFIAMAAWQAWTAWRFARCSAAAHLSITVDGRLEQRDDAVQRLELAHLVDVDVAPNSAFMELNEGVPIGSLFVLRLTDASGATVDVNPRMWAEAEAVTDIVRHHIITGRASITEDAAERYDLPLRGRHGEEHGHGHLSRGGRPPGKRPASGLEPELEAPLRELGIEVQRSAEVEPRRLHDEQ
jgi:hypothetical protein